MEALGERMFRPFGDLGQKWGKKWDWKMLIHREKWSGEVGAMGGRLVIGG